MYLVKMIYCGFEMKRLFGTSGIRGLINDTMKPEHCVKLGLSLATLLNNEGTVIVGYDHRPQAIVVKNAFISGLLSGGVDVIDVGVVPTPAVLYYSKKISPSAAVVITGSHTIPEIIGMLFFNKDTSEFAEPLEIELEKIFFSEKFSRVPWNRLGSVKTEKILETYIESVLSLINLSKVSSMKVVIDPGNGVSSGILGEILRKAEIRTISINDYLDPMFRNRDPFPRIDNLRELGRIVKYWGADLGVGVDGDGDRALFSDEKGNIYWGDVTGAIFAENTVKLGGKRVVVTINTSHIVIFAVKSAGGEIVFSKVGPPAIADAMKKNEACFGIEESGKYLWADAIYYGDAALATLRLLEIINDAGKPLSELTSKFPKFYMLKTAIRCDDKVKKLVLEKSSEILEKEIKNEISEKVTIDGVKIILNDDSWILLRPSGTEPVFRIFTESREKEKAEKLMNLSKKIVNKVISNIDSF